MASESDRHADGRLRCAVRAALRDAALHRATALALMGGGLLLLPLPITHAAELPVPCVAGVCGANIPGFVTSGAASAASVGNTLTVTQTSNSAVLNWQNFNVSADGVVTFVQPNSTSTALNRIHQADPARIFGALNANGRVFLLNRNGVLFGETAKVNVGGLLASTLDITPEALDRGIAGAGSAGAPAFTRYRDANGELESGAVTVRQGAVIATTEGGQVLMFAPEVVNEGTIRTPGGQTLLAAGSPVYLATSNDPGLRGLLVEVGSGGTVRNGVAGGAATDPTRSVGQIVAERGNVTLAGLAVNQLGRVSASTSVRANGSIRLQARDGGVVNPASGRLSASNGGQLTLGAGSVTSVTIESSADETEVDANAQVRSRVELQGRRIDILEGARVTANAGVIKATAQANPGDSTAILAPAPIAGSASDGSRIFIASGATLDVSGATTELGMERNVVRAELRGDELANSPLQRDGALRGQAVFVDTRLTGTRADGSTWVGTPLADVSGQVSLVGRTAQERNLAGGSVDLESQGDVVLQQGSVIDVSGGVVRYRDGFVNTSQLVGADGKLHDIGVADPNRVYSGIAAGYTRRDERWGVTETFITYSSQGRFEAGYVEGKDAGTVRILTPTAVVDGAIVGNVTLGRHQRRPAQTSFTGSLYRPYDQVPLAAQLALGTVPVAGTDRVAGDVLLGGGRVLPAIVSASGLPFDPALDELPDDLRTALRADLFGAGRVGRLDVQANGSIEVPAATALALPAGGSVALTGGQIIFDGQVSAAGGRVALTGVRTDTVQPADVAVALGATAVIDVAGRWINESVALNVPGAPLPPLHVAGGSVAVTSRQGSLRLAQGSVIDVSGGARVRASGAIVAGAAGSIELAATPDIFSTGGETFELGAQLLGYGIANGGSLSISAPSICISPGRCDAVLRVDPATLQAGGFSSLALRSTDGGLTVAGDTDLRLQQVNRILSPAAVAAPTGRRLDEFSTLGVLADTVRRPVNLSLTTSLPPLPLGLYTNAEFASAPGLRVEQGATISGDIGARLALRSNSTLVVNGQLFAPAGTISLTLDNTLPLGEVLGQQGLWLDASARLDVRGATRLQSNDAGLRVGDVLDGGSVTLLAQRGAVYVNAGAVIDASGTSAVIDVPTAAGTTATSAPRTVASDGGVISITAADAIVIGGELRAAAGAPGSGAVGGDLRVALDANQRQGAGERYLLDLGERRVIVTAGTPAVSVAPGNVLPDGFFGRAQLGAATIRDGGFGGLALGAATTVGLEDLSFEVVTPGVVEFAGGLTLDLPREMLVDAARVTGSGDVAFVAPYIRLGHSNTGYQQTTAPADRSGGSFTLQGALVELLGSSTVDGFDTIFMDSSGDLRLRGVQASGAQAVVGSVATSGDLRLRADQVYGSTLSDFTIAVEGADGMLRIESTGESRATLLSAGSRLSLRAASIEQGGVLRAPFGAIELRGDQVRLLDGSLTSTSAEGALIPFGGIQAGNDWVYGLRGQTLVVGESTPVPQQRVLLDGESVTLAAGAVIDVTGGGDMLAYEFIPGPTGELDILSATSNAGLFAIVPGLALDYAPYDPQESATSALRVGDSVTLESSVPGLAAGSYVLLPAAYALLPGAFVVSAVDGYQDMPAGAVVAQLDGSRILAGRRTVANTDIADARSSGFVIRTAAQVAELARYDTLKASEYLAARTAADDPLRARGPRDAGLLSVTAGTDLQLLGTLRATTAMGGRGAAVDISASRLLVGTSDAASAGAVVVDPGQLATLGAESLLLGGRRTVNADGTVIVIEADSVTIAGDTRLEAPELLLVASDAVRVESGAELEATGAADARVERYSITGDGALLRVAAGAQAEIVRTGETGATGTLDLEAGVRIDATGGSLALDASLDTRSAAQLVLPDGSLRLGAGLINLGAVPTGAPGLSLDAAAISALGLRELVLASRSTLDLYGDVSLDVLQLVLDAGGLRRAGATSGTVAITAQDSIKLTNLAGAAIEAAGQSSGALQLSAREIELGAGEQRVTGFATVDLTATGVLAANGDGGLTVDGDLRLRAPLLLVGQGADQRINAAGALRFDSTGAAGAQVDEAPLAGSLLLAAGRSLQVASTITAAAGRIELRAQDDVVLQDGASLDVAGRSREFDGTPVPVAAGDILLRSIAGDVQVEDGSRIDIAAAPGGRAGRLDIAAHAGSVLVQGTVAGSASRSVDSGRVSIDARSVGPLGDLNALLNAGGVYGLRSLRQRGVGDLVVDGADLRAHRVELTADGGSLIVRGVIDAAGETAGRVVLSARDVVSIEGTIDASGDSGAGGRVVLASESSGIVLGERAVVDVAGGGGQGGTVALRVPRAVALTMADDAAGNDGMRLGDAIVGARRILLEGTAVYGGDSGVLHAGTIGAATVAADDSNRLYREAVEFMASAELIATGLGRAGDTGFRVVPGIELRSAGDIALGEPGPGNQLAAVNWDLSTWRFGPAADVPGVLTIRAGGQLTFNGSLSDGFAGVAGNANSAAFRLAALPQDSWSYALVAGADLSSVDRTAVDESSTADFVIAPGGPSRNASTTSIFRMVRTGTGDIEVAAAGDFILGNRASVLYTAGAASLTGTILGTGSVGLGGRAYPVGGGDVTIEVGGDVIGGDAAGDPTDFVNQLVTDWLWRVGKNPAQIPNGFPTAWTVNFSRFEQNVGALGGGSVRVSAGGDIVNFSASVPSVGIPSARTAAASVLTVAAGGGIEIDAGGDIRGGSFYVGRGTGVLRAAGGVLQADNPLTLGPLYPTLALGDGSWTVLARGDLGLETVVNPTLLPQGRSQSQAEANQALFSTYAATSAVLLESAGGAVRLSNDLTRLTDWLSGSMPLSADSEQVGLRIYAPTLVAHALGGDLTIDRQVSLFPAFGSRVELFAQDDVTRLNPEEASILLQSDADPNQLPSVAAPTNTGAALLDALGSPSSQAAIFHAASPVHLGDDVVSRIVARGGDISLETPRGSLAGNQSLWSFATPVRAVAARDIVDLSLAVQHDDVNDLTSLVALGDLRYTISRSPTGAIQSNSLGIDVSGPGLLQLVAGRDVDLQTSRGVTTLGNLSNPALPTAGAGISVLAGLNGRQPAAAAMIERYLQLDAPPADIVAYVESVTGETGLTVDQAQQRYEQLAGYRAAMVELVQRRSALADIDEREALAIFEAYTPAQQRELLDAVLLAELRYSGRDSAAAGSGDFTRAFTALETFYPGSNPDTERDETNAYAGDISLYFSRIYALAGGDISLFAPGGAVNAGLATPPASFGLVKSASDLGIVIRGAGSVNSVSYGDFQVNESRVFATDGGNILVWSTNGDIDAGRGAKTAISAPPPTITFDENGAAIVNFPTTLTGSGIQTLATSPGVEPGDVDLFAPRGVVNAGDAGIVAGNLTIAATAVLGADNIQIGGVAVGVPVDSGGLGASLAGAAAAAGGAANAATAAVEAGSGKNDEQATPLADAAMSWLEVFVVGLGEEQCDQRDLECLKRQRQAP